MLLSINELLLTQSHKGWFYKFPELSFQLLRKYLLLPNPLTPDVAIFRTSWPKRSQSIDKTRLDGFVQALEPIQSIIGVLLLLLFIYLPVIALVYGSGAKLLIIFGMTYLFIFVILIYVFNNRDRLCISNSRFVSLAFEAVACPPFALNIVRKISLNYSNIGDPVSFSKCMFDLNSKTEFNRDISQVINKNIDFLEVGSERYLKLKKYLDKIKKEL